MTVTVRKKTKKFLLILVLLAIATCLLMQVARRVILWYDTGVPSEFYLQKIEATIGTSENAASAVRASSVEGKSIFFLPSCADLSALSMSFPIKYLWGENVRLQGDLGEVTLTETSAVIDIPALSSVSGDGTYMLSVSVGEHPSFSLTFMRSANIPALLIESAESVRGRAYVEAKKGNHTQGRMTILDEHGAAIYNGGLKEIKARGNTTFSTVAKKSYQVKLSVGADIFQSGEKIKTLILLANANDATMIHDKLLKDLAKEIGLAYIPDSDWVDLYYDGEYRGTYLATEKIAIGETGIQMRDLEAEYQLTNAYYGKKNSIGEGENAYGNKILYTRALKDPSDIFTGYLLELNLETITEPNGFMTTRGRAVNIRAPQYLSQAAMCYISEWYQAFEDAVYCEDMSGYNATTGKYYDEYIDMTSFVKVFMLQQLAINVDGFLSSEYFYLADDGKLYAGPIWDQDTTFGAGWTQEIYPTLNYKLHYLEENLIKIPSFRAAVDMYFDETFDSLLYTLADRVNAAGERLGASATMNYMLWDMVKVGKPDAEDRLWNAEATYGDVIEKMNDFIEKRIVFLEEHYGSVSSTNAEKDK